MLLMPRKTKMDFPSPRCRREESGLTYSAGRTKFNASDQYSLPTCATPNFKMLVNLASLEARTWWWQLQHKEFDFCFKSCGFSSRMLRFFLWILTNPALASSIMYIDL